MSVVMWIVTNHEEKLVERLFRANPFRLFVMSNVMCIVTNHEYYQTIPGDLNGDGTVGLDDLVMLAQAYGCRPGDPNWNPVADINGDGVVDLADLVILVQHYGQ